MSRRRRIGIKAHVASQQKKPVATITAAGVSASTIPRGPFSVGLLPRTFLQLTAQRPADCRALRPDYSAQNHLLGFSRHTRAEINALAETHFGTGSAQSPAHPARQSEQNRVAVFGHRGLHRGVEVKADSKGCAGPAGQPFLAAQILAIGGEKELSLIGQTESLTIAVMCCRDPLLAFV